MNHFSKQQSTDRYDVSVVYKVYFFKLYSLSANYVFMLILVYSAYILHFAQNYTLQF